MSDDVNAECRTILASISAYLEGDLDAAACETIERHSRGCPRCGAVVNGLHETIGLCREAGRAPLPEAVRQRARAGIERLLGSGSHESPRRTRKERQMGHQVQGDPAYGYTAHLGGVSFDEARARVTDALKAQGFGILTEIDVKATMKAKLDRDFRRYVILGACNPELAHRALEAELAVGLLLPCNVCLWEEEGGTVVSIAKPSAMFEVVKNASLQPLAGEVDQRMRRAVEQIGATAGKSVQK